MPKYFHFIICLVFFVDVKYSNASDDSKVQGIYKSRVSGGHIAKIEDHPYQVHLFPKKCGGTIIHERWILSAWSCNDPELTVLVGHDSIKDITSGNVEVKQTYRHRKKHIEYVIMLIQLKKNLDFNDTIKAVNYNITSIQDGYIGMVAGFGAKDQFAESSPYLHAVEIRVVTHRSCIQELPDYRNKLSTNSEVDFCGGYDRAEIRSLGGHHSHCDGDSGSGLIYDQDVIGVALYNERCGVSKNPGIFASVPFARKWIMETIAAHPYDDEVAAL